MNHPSLIRDLCRFITALLAPYKIADSRADDDDGAQNAVKHRITEVGGDESQGRGSKADADVERPEVSRRRKSCTRGRDARDGERLQGGACRAEARA